MNGNVLTFNDKIVEGARWIVMVTNKVFFFVVKRLFDIICALIGLVFLIPVAIIVKIAYMLTGDFTSIIFVQKRIGHHGKEFKFYKFRTMYPDADKTLKQLLEENEDLREEYAKNKKLANDPRITKMGRILRNTSLDELPQVINILNGTMAVIGNRPYLPREKEDMGSYYDSIISTKPGLTGYWQVHGRNDVSFQRRLELEQYYSEHFSLRMDVGIFFKTFKVVIFGRGAR